MDLLGELYGGIEQANAKESTRINSKMKIQILKCLYQYVELQNDELLLEIARIIFLVGTSINNYSICLRLDLISFFS